MHENISRFKRFAINVYKVNPLGKTDEEVARGGIKLNAEFWKPIGEPSKLREYGITEEDIERITDVAMIRGAFGNFKMLSEDDVRSILRGAF